MDVKSATAQVSSVMCRLAISASICTAIAAPTAMASTPPTFPFTLLTSFSSGSNGSPSAPFGSLVQGQDGNFYGLVAMSATTDGGMYSLTPRGQLATIYSFSSSSGTGPQSGPIQASNGTFYASLTDGAIGTSGTIVGITSSGQLSTLHTFAPITQTVDQLFQVNTDGEDPAASLVQASNGTLYGVTYTGGSTGGGTIYSITTSGQFTSMYTFPLDGTSQASTSGANPSGALIVGANGNLYGVTRFGGANGNGVIYSITPEGTESVLQSFPTSSTPGYCGASIPPAAETMTLGVDGMLYGTKCGGGANNTGYLYRFDPSTSTITDLYDFAQESGSNVGGSYPSGSLAVGPDGNLYGTAQEGGANGYGTAFVATLNGSLTTIYNFSVADGEYPWPLTVGSDNNFYGTALGGGANLHGTAFKLQHLAQNDIVLSNNSAGVLDTRLINQLSTQQIVQNVAQGYYPVAVGDFDGDGIPDILWTSAKNDLYIWFGGNGSSTGFKSKYVGTYPADWQVVGAGDVDGDGKSDIYWINPTTHQFGYWLMNGAVETAHFITPYTPGYYPIALGDFNGDGKTDVVWSSANNDLYIWFSNAPTAGASFTSEYAGTFPSGWKLAGTGDLDGDGNTDLVWMKNDGTEWGYWLMDGVQRRASVVQELSGAGLGYSIVNVSDYTHDGRADLVWSNGSSLYLWTNTDSSGSTAVSFSSSQLAAPTSGATVFNNNVH
jgi:uncharacterized repeat protein (TIGR03803 family)